MVSSSSMREVAGFATIDRNSNRNEVAVNIVVLSNKINTCIYFVYTMGVL